MIVFVFVSEFYARRLQIIARMTKGSLPRAFRDVCQQITLATLESAFTSTLPQMPSGRRTIDTCSNLWYRGNRKMSDVLVLCNMSLTFYPASTDPTDPRLDGFVTKCPVLRLLTLFSAVDSLGGGKWCHLYQQPASPLPVYDVSRATNTSVTTL